MSIKLLCLQTFKMFEELPNDRFRIGEQTDYTTLNRKFYREFKIFSPLAKVIRKKKLAQFHVPVRMFGLIPFKY